MNTKRLTLFILIFLSLFSIACANANAIYVIAPSNIPGKIGYVLVPQSRSNPVFHELTIINPNNDNLTVVIKGYNLDILETWNDSSRTYFINQSTEKEH